MTATAMAMAFLALLAHMAAVAAAVAAAAAAAAVAVPPRDAYPHVIAHRGACGYVPEHSLQAYQLAMDLETDYVETDLVLSKDGVFMAMHDMCLDNTTNVADFPQWADRHTTKLVDGKNMTGFFASDFLLSELKQMRLRQRLYQRNTLYNELFQMPTLQEVVDEVQANYNKTLRTVGLYIELKHPSYSRAMGFDLEGMLLAQLSAAGYHVYKDDPLVSNDLSKVNPLIYECFDAESLQIMGTLSTLPRVLLLEKQATSFWTRQAMLDIAQYADGIGPEKSFLENGSYVEARALVDMIYSAGLRVHPWTFRADQDVGTQFEGDFDLEEMYFYCCLGMDGVFTEFPDRARETVDVVRGLPTPRAPRGAAACPIDCAAVWAK